MRKAILLVALFLSFVSLIQYASALSVSTVPQGGTGWGNITVGTVLLGNGTTALSTTTRGNLTGTGITVTGGTNAVLGVGAALTCQTASGAVFGCLLTSDWTTFNNKFATTSTDAWLATKTTTNLTEGSNLYYTDARARASITAIWPLANNSGVISSATSSASSAGVLSAADWTTFNNKGNGTLTAVTGTYPVISSGGTTPAISIAFGTTTANTWSGLQTFTNAATTSFTGGLSLSTGCFQMPSGACITGGTTYSATYPVTLTGSAFGLAFGTTTANVFNALNTFTNATTTLLSAPTVWNSNIISALWLGDANGKATAATAQTCTNQFLRAMGADYSKTCATVGAADVSLANLSATDSTLTFSGTYTGATARTIGINLGNANTWTALQTINNASTTNLTVGTFAALPTNSNCTAFALGSFCLDTTSNQLQVGTSSSATPIVYNPIFHISNNQATSTWTGTTTLPFAAFTDGGQLKGILCWTDAGTLDVQISYGPAKTTLPMIIASSTGFYFAYSGVGSIGANATSTISIGTPVSSPTQIECTADGYFTKT